MTDGTTTWSYEYNADSLRTSRTDGTTTYKYVYNGSQLVQMSVGNVVLYFTSDTVTYNNTVYYYVTNLQGDIVAILNSSGTAVVQYTYDAWGNILSTSGELANTLGTLNPLRYRGYVHDPESGFYYLQSRYYDPKLGRFLNADALMSTGQGIIGNNMFAYCGNNPVNLIDPSGYTAVANAQEGLSFILALLALVDSATPFLEIGIMVLAIAGAGSVVLNATQEKEETKTETIAVPVGDNNQTYYTVYFLCAADDPSYAVIYVGRVKTANYASRMTYHRGRGRISTAQVDGLTYEECRYLEQAGMMYYHTIGRGEPYKNQIRGISPTNPKIEIYLKAGYNLIQSRFPDNSILPPSFLRNRTENELLNAGC